MKLTNNQCVIIGGLSTSAIATIILFTLALINGVDPKKSLLLIGLIYIAVIIFVIGAILGTIVSHRGFDVLSAIAFSLLFNSVIGGFAYLYFESPRGNSGIKPIILSLMIAGVFSSAIVSLANSRQQP